MLIANVALESA